MTFMQAKPQQPSRVAAVFRDAAISLKIAHQTTFAQLAELLSRLAEIHGELMCPVQVRLPVPVYAPTAAHGRKPSDPYRICATAALAC